MTGLITPPRRAARAHPGRRRLPPVRVVPNAEIVEAIDSSDEWIQQRSGIETRHCAGPRETVADDVARRPARRSRAPGSTRPDRRVVVATVSHPTRPRPCHRVADQLGTDQRRRLRHLRRLRRLLLRHRARQRHGPRRRAAYVLVVGVECSPTSPTSTDRGRPSSSATARARPSSDPSDTAGIGPTVWGSEGEKSDLIRQTRGLARRRHHRDSTAARCRTCACRASGSSAGRREMAKSRQRRWRAPASPSTTSTSSSPTRPTCASSTRWQGR